MPERTFAAASSHALRRLGLIEVFEYPGWTSFMNEAVPILPSYQRYLNVELERRSAAAWRTRLQNSSCNFGPKVLVQAFPVCAGHGLLEAGHLDGF